MTDKLTLHNEMKEDLGGIERGLGRVTLVTVLAFWIFNLFIGEVSLGWIWIGVLLAAYFISTIAVGIVPLIIRLLPPATVVAHPKIYGIVTQLWFLASFFVAWQITGALARWAAVYT